MSATCSRCATEAPDDARFCQVCGAAMGDGDSDLIGKVVARKYKVLDAIGEGSMGRIYLAEHIGLEKRVALKVLHREVVLGPEGLQRFRREGIAAGKLSHPNAIEIFDFDMTESGDAFLAMEYIEGRDLRRVLEEDGSMDLERACDIILQALDALHSAHLQGIVHRDLKPENIMLTEGSAGPRVKVLDFGLSKLVDSRVEASLATVPGRIIGTPFYMAPEQSSGEEADTRSDLYAMGVIFHELLVGQRPFTGRNLTELLYAQATQDVPSVREIVADKELPPWVDAFIEKALERDRADRYQTAKAMAQDLKDRRVDASTVPRRARATTGRAGGVPSSHRGLPKWALPAGAGALVISVAAITSVLLGGGGDKDVHDSSGSPVSTSGTTSARVRVKDAALRSESEATYLRLLDNARAQIRAGNPDGAEGTLNVIMELPQVDAEAYLVRGSMYLVKGDLDAAAADVRSARRMDESYTEATALLGWVEFERHRVDEALACFDAALDSDDAYADALAGRAAVLRVSGGGEEEARALLTRAVAADHECWRAQLGLAELGLATGQLDVAVDCFVEAKRINPRSREAVLGLARAYQARERPEDAIAQYRAVLSLSRNDPEAVRGVSSVYLDLGRFGDAEDLLAPIVERGGADPRDRALLGLARHGLGDEEGATRALESAVDAGIADARPKALLAALLLDAGNPQRALRMADAAIEDDFEFADGHLYSGLALFRLERYEEAALALRQAVDLDAGSTTALLVLGALGLDYLRDGSRAAADLRAYIEAGGDDPRATRWLAEIEGR